MADFDAIRALREELAGMNDIARLVASLTHQAEAQHAEAEAKHNAMLKLDAFMKGVIKPMRDRLADLEAEAVKAAGGG